MSGQSESIHNELLALLKKLALPNVSNMSINLPSLPEFRQTIYQLCTKNPKAAKEIAETIQEVMIDSQDHSFSKRKRKTRHDVSYRPPTTSRTRRSARIPENNIPQAPASNMQGSSDNHKELIAPRLHDKLNTQNDNMLDNKGGASKSTTTAGDTRSNPPARLSSSKSSLDARSTNEASITVAQAAQTIYHLNKHVNSTRRHVHARILQSLQDGQQSNSSSEHCTWSDGSIWIDILEMGSSDNKKITIFNMLEYIGAWQWYTDQIQLAKHSVKTKRNKLVSHKGAATHVLNKIQEIQMNTDGKDFAGLGRIILNENQVTGNDIKEINKAGITEQARQLKREYIKMCLNRGQKLRTKLVKNLGLGVLFAPRIWDITKMPSENLDSLVQSVQSDSKQMKLLKILSPQVQLLIDHGSTSLHEFYKNLLKEYLVTEDELHELKVAIGLGSDSFLNNVLNNTVDQLITNISTRIFGKTTLTSDDTISVNDSAELSSEVFERLRPAKWFDAWTILASMQVSDKPCFVRYYISTPLDSTAGEVLQKPLGRLRGKIMGNQKGAQELSLVHFCPINHKNSHFTLLEINETEQTIRHYDSQANLTGKKTRLSTLVEEEFKAFNFSYIEAPTPQQSDTWSCGIRVVWNFRRLSNGLPIGTWDTRLSPERMKLEIIQGFEACLESNAMRRYR